MNFTKPDNIDERIWNLFLAIVTRTLHDITSCKEIKGLQGYNFAESKSFFRKRRGLDIWLSIIGVRGDDKNWNTVRFKGHQMAVKKEKELLRVKA